MRTLALAFVVGFLGATAVAAEESTVRSYPLPKHGSFQIMVPMSWSDSLAKPLGALPPTVTLTPTAGSPFQVVIVPIWQFTPDMPMPRSGEMKSMIQRAAQGVAQQAVEKSLEVKEFEGSTSTGYYFSATDKAPKPGEFEYLTQGMIGVSDLAVTFTILTNDGQENVVKEALAMLSTATHKKR